MIRLTIDKRGRLHIVCMHYPQPTTRMLHLAIKCTVVPYLQVSHHLLPECVLWMYLHHISQVHACGRVPTAVARISRSAQQVDTS